MTEGLIAFCLPFGIAMGISFVMVAYNVMMMVRDYWNVRLRTIEKEANARLELLEGMNR